MTPPLSVVADNSAEKAKSATDLSERIRRLQAEALEFLKNLPASPD